MNNGITLVDLLEMLGFESSLAAVLATVFSGDDPIAQIAGSTPAAVWKASDKKLNTVQAQQLIEAARNERPQTTESVPTVAAANTPQTITVLLPAQIGQMTLAEALKAYNAGNREPELFERILQQSGVDRNLPFYLPNLDGTIDIDATLAHKMHMSRSGNTPRIPWSDGRVPQPFGLAFGLGEKIDPLDGTVLVGGIATDFVDWNPAMVMGKQMGQDRMLLAAYGRLIRLLPSTIDRFTVASELGQETLPARWIPIMARFTDDMEHNPLQIALAQQALLAGQGGMDADAAKFFRKQQ